MKEKESNKDQKQSIIERIFKITKTENQVSLKGSIAIVNKEASETLFENEVYMVIFSTQIKEKLRSYSLFLSPSETIPKKESNNLRRALDIQISGDGMLLNIDYYIRDFTIQFDQYNSISIDNSDVKKGVITFKCNLPKIDKNTIRHKRLQNKRLHR